MIPNTHKFIEKEKLIFEETNALTNDDKKVPLNLNKNSKSKNISQSLPLKKPLVNPDQKNTNQNNFNKKEENLYLNETEKDGLYSLMGVVNEQLEELTGSSKFKRNYSILSVEYLFETKYENENRVNIKDDIFNSKLLAEVKKVLELNESDGLQSILQEYNNSIKNKIIVSSLILQEIIKCCLR